MDLVFIGPIVGGLLALAGTVYLAVSANKRESIAAAERQLEAWHVVAVGEATRGGYPDILKFVAQAPFLWSDHEAWEIHNSVAKHLTGQTTGEDPLDSLQDKFTKLRNLGVSRIAHLSRVLEDMKRRSAWTFIRTEYVNKPGEYRFHVLRKE